MAKSPQSKDEALEALDFIVNVLKEHERDLDKIIGELVTVAEQMGDTGELSGKMGKVEEKISSLQKEVANLVSVMSAGAPKDAPQLPQVAVAKEQQIAPVVAAAAPVVAQSGPLVVLRCAQWKDFVSLAFGAQNVSFSYKEDGKVFQADAIKGNQIIRFTGIMPKFTVLFRAFLARELGVSEQSLFEGSLTIG